MSKRNEKYKIIKFKRNLERNKERKVYVGIKMYSLIESNHIKHLF